MELSGIAVAVDPSVNEHLRRLDHLRQARTLHMNARTRTGRTRWLLALCLFSSLHSTGCLGLGWFQTTIGGQTLPSAYYLDDDVQFFPAGPETKLANQIRALERYKVEREGLTEGGQY
jgi:hypothetical protein